jgi:hypothetical protein
MKQIDHLPDGSYWVEFDGGPWDGQMAYFRFEQSATWHSYSIHPTGYLPVPDGGFYSIGRWKDEELRIPIMEWFQGPIPEDIWAAQKHRNKPKPNTD